MSAAANPENASNAAATSGDGDALKTRARSEREVDPRPVTGTREYALILATPKPVGAEVIRQDAARLLEAAGARHVTTVDGWSLYTLDVAGVEAFGIALRVTKGKDATEIALRMRPAWIHQNNYWPPPPLLGVTQALVKTYELRANGEQVPLEPKNVTGAIVQTFVQRVLLAKDRLPILVITPGPYSAPDAAAQTALDLAGLATVYITDIKAPLALQTMLTKERAVFGGAVRIYRPGFTAYDDPLEHDLLVAHYLERRLTQGRTLAAEVARRLLPNAGDPLPFPKEVMPSRPFTLPELPKQPTSLDRIEDLQRALEGANSERQELHVENSFLREENRRLNAALRAAKERIRALEGGPKAEDPTYVRIEGLPWPVSNPVGLPVRLSDVFPEQARKVARDGSLGDELRNKMETVLEAPEDYGKPMRGARKGQRSCHVSHNYRLVWSVEGDAVRFVLIVSKEDPEYSPHGA